SGAASMKEAQFDTNELFFSITDHASTILSGNDVFVNISGYEKEELIGQFHNIIRHPDMPKVIFKILWDHLKSDKPIVAYVKNKTKEGGFYWVLAVVFPLSERYISIRIKPNSPIFAIVRELYFKLLIAESRGGMEASEAMLLELLLELGYSGYNHFMADALLSELSKRKELLTDYKSDIEYVAESNNPLCETLKILLNQSQTLMRRYEHWFDKIDMFKTVKTTFEEKGVVLRHLARDIVFLSLNASVASYKVANGGETFGVLASDVRINAKENDRLIGHIHTLAQTLSDTLNELIFTVSSLRIQIEMVTYFIEETMQKKGEISLIELGENLNALVSLVLVYSEKLNDLQVKMDCFIQESLKNLDQLERQVMYLGYIQVYGVIEAASDHNETIDFGGIFSQLKELIRSTSEEITVMLKLGNTFHSENRHLIQESTNISNIINQFRFEADTIKTIAL
ncbi:MAG: PAS domain-containing protein, partial [Sulfuricurvum sp.]|uniref:PAS domain-containing protein n=1 Tax=Sulfuricurvum sp. TaxID=2025608 RepID=UPI0025F93BBB